MIWVAALAIGWQAGHIKDTPVRYKWTFDQQSLEGQVSFPIELVPISEQKHIRALLTRHGIRNDRSSFINGPGMVSVVRLDQLKRAQRLLLKDAKAQGYLKFLREHPIENIGNLNFGKTSPRYLPGHC